MRLLLIRHGQTPHNVTGALDTGFPGAGLTDLGITQAAAVPAALGVEDIAGVYASPLVRTQLTAAPLARDRGLTTEVVAGLEEVSAGAWELRSDPEGVHGYTDCLAGWMSGDWSRVMEGGPDGLAFLARYRWAVEQIEARHAPDATVAVFTHGAAMRVFTAYAARLAASVSTGLSVANTGMAVLVGDSTDGWRSDQWSRTPLGGPELLDRTADDVTGDSAQELDE